LNQARSNSGTTSPSQTRDGLGQQSIPDPHIFPSRPAVGQNGNAFASRSKINGNFGPSFGGLNDGLDNGSPYSTIAAKFSFDGTSAFKRGSQGEFSAVGQSRENSISGARPNDFSVQTTPGSTSHDLPQYPFDGSSRGSISRPSGSHQPASFPLNSGSGRILPSAQASIDAGLSDLLAGSLGISDNRGTDAVTNGILNPATRPFQFDPSSQTWNGEPTAGGRSFGPSYQQQDLYSDQIPGSYMDVKRGSVERASPSSMTFPRNALNSPRYTPGLGSRADSWPHGRPISRGPSMSQEYDRQSSTPFSQVPHNFYSAGSYYGSNFSSQYNPQMQPYEMYGQTPTFRGQMSVPQFGLVNQYMPQVNIPVRPSRDQDPGKGVRSVLLEDFRASNRSNKRFELKVCTKYPPRCHR
jgi:mRNA-binding protein PUF3